MPIVGREFAESPAMLLFTIQMWVVPEKRVEIMQTLISLSREIRRQDGCCRFDYGASVEDDNELCLWGEWENKESLAQHYQSEPFKVLLGAMSLLKNPYEMNTNTLWEKGEMKPAEKTENAANVPV